MKVHKGMIGITNGLAEAEIVPSSLKAWQQRGWYVVEDKPEPESKPMEDEPVDLVHADDPSAPDAPVPPVPHRAPDVPPVT
jgi:hypothetical protein